MALDALKKFNVIPKTLKKLHIFHIISNILKKLCLISRILKIFLIISLFASPFCFADWNFKKQYDDVFIYTSKNNTRLVLNYKQVNNNNKKINKKLIKELENTKKEMLKLMNIKEWKLKTSKIKKEKNLTQVTLSGYYIAPNKEKIYFTEHHFYSPFKKLQFLLTNSKKKALNKDSKINKLQKLRDKYEI